MVISMKDAVCDLTIVIPSFNPDEKLNMVVKGLKEKGFHDIVIVNDGSDERHMQPFLDAEDCTVIHHGKNKGKGRAMKTAFMFCLENRQQSEGVITVDGDNQHIPDDVYACGKAMLEKKNQLILGCRDFNDPKVPFKSKFGNKLTKSAFHGLCGVKVSDTQTGLRAIPMQFLPLMLQIEGERYEYETNMLLEMKNYSIQMFEVPIQTVYINDNESSHFHPIRDSFKIYKVILKFFMNSILSTLIDLSLFFVFSTILHRFQVPATIAIFSATAMARICSSICNYKINRKVVFKTGNSSSFAKYYILCACQMLVSATIVNGFAMVLLSGSLVNTILKAITDTCLFFVSFRIQKNWVFKTQPRDFLQEYRMKAAQMQKEKIG